MRSKSGISLKPIPVKIVAKERYVNEGCKIYKELSEKCGYEWIMDIIDYFTKYMMSFPLISNTAENILIGIKAYWIMIGYLKINQTDNGSEYKNQYWKNFFLLKI